MENPNLLEHDAFANLLLAVFHLTEELAQRRDLHHLTPGDREHLAGDIERAYVLLIAEWLDYMQHLQKNYPYLFSLARRTNPFDPEASVVINSMVPHCGRGRCVCPLNTSMALNSRGRS